MIRIIALLICGAAVAACSSSSISRMDPNSAFAMVHVGSLPAGAEARLGGGPACRTPCQLPLPSSGIYSVNFTLNGYLPQSLPVEVSAGVEQWDMADAGIAPTIHVAPDPMIAQLEPAPQPAPARKKRAPAKPKPPAPEAAPAFGSPPPPPGFR